MGNWERAASKTRRRAPGERGVLSYLAPMGKQSEVVAEVLLVLAFASDELVLPVELMVQNVTFVAFLTSKKPPGEINVVSLVVVVCAE